jgi:hypothetical protein
MPTVWDDTIVFPPREIGELVLNNLALIYDIKILVHDKKY